MSDEPEFDVRGQDFIRYTSIKGLEQEVTTMLRALLEAGAVDANRD